MTHEVTPPPVRLPRRRRYPTLQAWMQATGTNAAELARRAGITQAHMSNILSRSRRCSIKLGWKLSQITGVPMETIVAWPPVYEPRTGTRG